jgi:hypothetical protein
MSVPIGTKGRESCGSEQLACRDWGAASNWYPVSSSIVVRMESACVIRETVSLQLKCFIVGLRMMQCACIVC